MVPVTVTAPPDPFDEVLQAAMAMAQAPNTIRRTAEESSLLSGSKHTHGEGFGRYTMAEIPGGNPTLSFGMS